MDNNKGLSYRIADFLNDYGWEVFSTLPTIALAFWGAYYSSIQQVWLRWALFCIIASFTIVCTIAVCKKKGSYTKICSELNEKGLKIQELENSVERFGQENTALFNNFLYLFAKSIGLKNEDRITVYKNSQDSFVTIGRYSPNPKYQSFHRKSIPITEGFIAKALEREEVFIDSLPECSKPKQIKNYHSAVSCLCDITEDALSSLNMKSRTYYCKALTDPTGMNRKAIVVIESTKPQRFTQQTISEQIKTEEMRIQAFVEKCRFLPVDTSLANSKGF
jgi:hypothetical protein